MAAAPALWAVGRDMLWCLGLGLLLAAARDLLGLLAGNGRVLCFLWDVLGFAAAAVLLHSICCQSLCSSRYSLHCIRACGWE